MSLLVRINASLGTATLLKAPGFTCPVCGITGFPSTRSLAHHRTLYQDLCCTWTSIRRAFVQSQRTNNTRSIVVEPRPDAAHVGQWACGACGIGGFSTAKVAKNHTYQTRGKCRFWTAQRRTGFEERRAHALRGHFGILVAEVISCDDDADGDDAGDAIDAIEITAAGDAFAALRAETQRAAQLARVLLARARPGLLH